MMQDSVAIVDRQSTTVVVNDEGNIQTLIKTIRGVQVILDRDISRLYGVATGALNRQVKRNEERFPEDFMFQLTKEEWESLKCQIGISNVRGGDRRALPYVFTEQGVSQLSGVLHNALAEEISVKIMRAFVAMRRFITANAGLFQRVGVLEQKQIETDKKLDVVLDKIEELSPAVTTEELFGTGCAWDAYSFLSSLVRRAHQRIILIDNFVDERTLLLLDKRAFGVECTVHTRFSKQTELDFAKHNEQNAEIKKIQLPLHIHDRYLIIDDEVWLLGASAKDMGQGLCTIIKVDFTPEMVLSFLKE